MIREKAERTVDAVPALMEEAADPEIEEEDEEDGGIDRESLIGMVIAEPDLAAVEYRMMEEDGCLLTMDDYASYIDKLAEAIPGSTRSEVETSHSVFDYAVERCSDYLAGAVDRYVAEQYKAIITKEI